MKSNIDVIYDFHPYTSRKFWKSNNLADYENHEFTRMVSVNFSYSDQVTAELVCNNPEEAWKNATYVVEYDDRGNIMSRWFVMRAEVTRLNQLRLTLLRDVLADFFNTSTPVFVQRSMLLPTDKFIFNREGINFNQVKTSEELLRDPTRVSWLVCYLAKNFGKAKSQDGTELDHYDPNARQIKLSTNRVDNVYDAEGTSLPFSDGQVIRTADSAGRIEIGVEFFNDGWWVFDNVRKVYFVINLADGTVQANGRSTVVGGSDDIVGTIRESDDIDRDIAKIKSCIENSLLTDFINLSFTSFGICSSKRLSELKTLYVNKTITYKLNSGSSSQYYFISARENQGNGSLFDPRKESNYSSVVSTLTNQFINAVNSTTDLHIETDRHSDTVKYSQDFHTITFSVIRTYSPNTSVVKVVTVFPLAHTTDNVYDIITIPYGDNITFNNRPFNKDMAMAFVNSLMKTDICYDVQLLPYSPLSSYLSVTVNEADTAAETVNLHIAKKYETDYTFQDDPTEDEGKIYQVVSGEGDSCFPIIACKSCFHSFPIWLKTPVVKKGSAIDIKVQNECYLYRLSSPNYASSFDFSVAKNDGLTGFDIDCAFRPYQPYIHISPKFSGLYGKDFNDTRGLTLAGDFSIDRVKDQWEQYVLQNKNYQMMFDRDIQNMDVNYQLDMTSNGISGTLGALSTGLSSGIMAGIATGNPVVGAVAGGAMTAASIGGMAADMAIASKKHNEAIDYAKDKFNMQLQNIQALPYTLSKVSAFNPNNKIFPVLEVYRATDEEISAFRSYLKHRGMRTERIDTMSNSQPGFFQGDLVDDSNIKQPSNIVDQIRLELQKGIYI